MVNYEKIFEPYYEGGWEAYPLETTLVTAGALNAYDAAIMHIEDYLDTQVDPNDNLAKIYSDEETYEAGDYRIYNGVLYKCLEDIDEAEDFDPTKWESCLVTDEMATSGGTTVIANPVGTPTDDLETIQIGETIYDIPGGGGGNANIWTGTQAELEEVFEELEEGTQINITDDEQEVVEGGTIYSEEEQVIGLWTDNRPLYQRTYVYEHSATLTSNTNMFALDDAIEVKYVEGYIKSPERLYPLPYANGSKSTDVIVMPTNGVNYLTLVIIGDSWSSSYSPIVTTIKYTKSTDAPLDAVVGKKTMYIASSDCYSTEEKEIGCHVDGKPLYQKSFNFPSGLAIAMGAWTDVDSSIPNVGYDKIVRVFSIDSNGTYQGDLLCGVNSSNHIQLQSQRNGSGNITSNYLTIQYTKTTDTAGSGQYTPASGKAVHYSTDEQVIGTWVDGSTIYQKTVLHSGVITGAQTATQIAHGITNLGRIIQAEATVYDDHSSPSWMSVPRIAYDANNIGFSGIDNTYINFYVPSAFGNRIKDAHFVLTYTKSV